MSPQLQVISVIGVDPGPTTGISFIDYSGLALAGHMRLQVDGKSACAALEAIIGRYYSDPEVIIRRAAQVEPFITGYSAGTRGKPAEETRQLAFQITELLQGWGYSAELNTKKGDISTWASDKRLKAAGILGPPEMRHANDASRHALYRAVHYLYRPDPLR